jgi:DNA-directed RNA polymerase specialized sigma24 family protein
VRHDLERVADLARTGFTGPLYQQFADELYLYAYGRLRRKMRTGEIAGLTGKSATPLCMTEDELSTLHRDDAVRDQLAVHTIAAAMHVFIKALKRGGYRPAAHPGRDGRPTTLKSYFFGMCLIVFPREFDSWRAERQDRFLAAAARMPPDLVQRALGQTAREPVPEALADLCDRVTGLINSSPPRVRAVMLLTLHEYSQSEIVDLLQVKIGDVENARFRFRQKARKRMRHGQLHLLPWMRAESLRSKRARNR